MARLPQTALGVGTTVLGLLMAAGATQISSDAGYAGVGPNFLPWVVGLALTLCGLWMVWEARTGGFREMEEPSGADSAHWPGFVWVSVGLLANALLIERVGFILSCTLCFVLAVRGFRSSEGHSAQPLAVVARDVVVGALIAAPVFWMFTKLLAINLPGLTQTGWL
jgi:putative tricarboxylic transport membrane protein